MRGPCYSVDYVYFCVPGRSWLHHLVTIVENRINKKVRECESKQVRQ